ncbi:hypothetical protein EB061_06325 [bacterium]|jgi:hypothetical protein|nr:hypothetical protein [bacterium]
MRNIARQLGCALGCAIWILSWGAGPAEARPSPEDQYMIANGQGISSPSFWEGLKGQNPAGLVNNQRIKFQGTGAFFSDSWSNPRASAAVLAGLGPLGMGIEYSQFDRAPYAPGTSAINWGLATGVRSLGLSLGVSGRHFARVGSYTVGLAYQPLTWFRLALLLPNVNQSPKVFGGGVTLEVDPAMDLVLDAATDTRSSALMLKPGITLHADRFHVSGAYGHRYRGSSDPMLSSGLTAAVGLKVSEHWLIEYSYQGLCRHLLGLTLR